MKFSWAKSGYLVKNFFLQFNTGRLAEYYVDITDDTEIYGVLKDGRRII